MAHAFGQSLLPKNDVPVGLGESIESLTSFPDPVTVGDDYVAPYLYYDKAIVSFVGFIGEQLNFNTLLGIYNTIALFWRYIRSRIVFPKVYCTAENVEIYQWLLEDLRVCETNGSIGDCLASVSRPNHARSMCDSAASIREIAHLCFNARDSIL